MLTVHECVQKRINELLLDLMEQTITEQEYLSLRTELLKLDETHECSEN